MKLSEKQWNLINDIALRIHMIDDMTEMRNDFMSVFSVLVSFDAASFYLMKDGNPYGDPIGYNLTQQDLEHYVEHFSRLDPFAPLMGMFASGDEVIRTSDYALTADMENTDYYKLAWKPKGIKNSLFVPLVLHGQWLGSVTFFRSSQEDDFSDMDLYISNIFKKHLQARLWREFYLTDNGRNVRGNQDKARLERLAQEYDLTNRECDVVDLWAKGLTDPEICEQLAISKNTLKKHISNIFGKVQINSRVELLKVLNRE